MDLSPFVSPALISALILAGALVLFVTERVRHDLIAVLALLAGLITGVVKPEDALSGFGDPAVVAVAAVLIVGRTLELSGVAAKLARYIMFGKATYSLQMAMLMAVGALLSAFMNNIAALVIVMPLGAEIARQNKKAVGTILMPLAFATIMGGMITLIGTPANMILSSVREERLGQGFGFFAMAPVGIAVAVVGILYLAVIGWRLLPPRRGTMEGHAAPWKVFELTLTHAVELSRHALSKQLHASRTRLLRLIRRDKIIDWPEEDRLKRGDKLLLLSRYMPGDVADSLEVKTAAPLPAEHEVTAHMVVAHGSPIIGERYDAITHRSGGALNVTAGGPRAARLKQPLGGILLQGGDQLFIRGQAADIARFGTQQRLLEIDRADTAPVNIRAAIQTVGIFVLAIAVTVLFDVSPALTFLAAAAAMAALRLIPAPEIYKSIDWSVIVLLAAMIPVGQSFESSGAAKMVADALAGGLQGAPLILCIAAVCGLTLFLTILLNNVATALIMGPLAIQLAQILHVSPDALLLAVLVGTSSDFLTPIGHQNNLLVMAPGGYRFTDYARAGALLAVLVVATTAFVLSTLFGG